MQETRGINVVETFKARLGYKTVTKSLNSSHSTDQSNQTQHGRSHKLIDQEKIYQRGSE